MTITSAAATYRTAWLVEFSDVAQVDALVAAAKTEDVLDAPTRYAAIVTAPAGSAVLSIMMVDGMVTGVDASNPFTALPNINGDGGAYYIPATQKLAGAVWTSAEQYLRLVADGGVQGAMTSRVRGDAASAEMGL